MSTSTAAREAPTSKPRTLVALSALWLSTLLGWSWPWGVLFLWMTVESLRRGETSLVESITRAENPVVFSLTVATWFSLSVAMIVWDVVLVFAPGWLTGS